MASRSVISQARISVVGAWVLCSSGFPAQQPTFARSQEPVISGLQLVSAQVFVAPAARTPSTRIEDTRGAFHEWCAADTNREGFGLLPLELVWKTTEGGENVATRYAGRAQFKHRRNALLDEVTRQGMQEAVMVGRSLRDRFTSLFDGDFGWEVLASSSCSAIDTAHGVASGFSSNDDSRVAKVSVFGPEQQDWLAFPNTPLSSCPALVQIVSTSLLASNERLRNTDKGKRVRKAFKERFGLQLSLGKTMENLDNSVEFFQIFRNQVACEFDKTNSMSLVQLKADLDELAAHQLFDMISGGKEENRTKTMLLVTGSLVQNLLESLQEGGSEQTVRVLSCGDRTWMSVMLCLDPFGTNDTQRTRSWPLNCEDITFELWRDCKNNRYVRITVSDNPIHVPGVPAVTPGGYFYTADSIKGHLQQFALAASASQLCS